jgi:hypothetical protein
MYLRVRYEKIKMFLTSLKSLEKRSRFRIRIKVNTRIRIKVKSQELKRLKSSKKVKLVKNSPVKGLRGRCLSVNRQQIQSVMVVF